LELAIDGMTCGHCVAAVTRALKECHGVASVQVDLATGRAVVTGEHLDARDLTAAVGAAGYRASRIVDGPPTM
jgi:copper chaperone CopZ